MTQPEKSDCGTTGSRNYAYNQGCRCDACRRAKSAYKRTMRAAGAAWAERERETSRRWKRVHLGQPGKPARS